MTDKVKCELCNKEYSKKGIGTHIWRKHGEGINHITNSNIGYKNGTRIVWNKGLTQDTDERVKQGSSNLKKRYDSGELISTNKGKSRSPETILKLKQNSGGVRKGAGRGKNGWYKGYWCDSSWELAFVIYNLDNNIKFERNTEGFEYTFENEKHKYYPDFIIDNKYVEIKGHMNDKSISKIEQFENNLIIIDKNNIKKYLDYTIDKYGKKYIKLYEIKK